MGQAHNNDIYTYEVISLFHALSEKHIYVLFSIINNIQLITFLFCKSYFVICYSFNGKKIYIIALYNNNKET